MRKCTEGAGKGGHVVTRALCDAHTPDQWWTVYGPFVYYVIFIAVLGCIGAAVYFGFVQPMQVQEGKDRHDREQQQLWIQQIQEKENPRGRNP